MLFEVRLTDVKQYRNYRCTLCGSDKPYKCWLQLHQFISRQLCTCYHQLATISVHAFTKPNLAWYKFQLEIWGRDQRKATRRHKPDCRDNFGWFKCRSQQRYLANQSGKLSEIAPKFHLGGSTCAPITFLFVVQSSPSFFAQRVRSCSWSNTFPIFDMWIRSGDIRNRSR